MACSVCTDLSRRPRESGDPYAASVILRDAVRRLSRHKRGLWLWVPDRARCRFACPGRQASHNEIFVLSFRHGNEGRARMAKKKSKKPAARAAATKKAAQKKSPARKATTKPSAAKSTARKKLASKGRA